VSTTKARQRSTAEECREAVVEAAIDEFGKHGYQAAMTGAIAKRGRDLPALHLFFFNL
jgi:AcrR family transcriptional regulator